MQKKVDLLHFYLTLTFISGYWSIVTRYLFPKGLKTNTLLAILFGA